MAVTEKDILMQKLNKQTGETIIMYPITKKENILGLEVEKEVYSGTNSEGTTLTLTCRRQGNIVNLNFEYSVSSTQFGSMMLGTFNIPNIPERYRPTEKKTLNFYTLGQNSGQPCYINGTLMPTGGILGSILNKSGDSMLVVLNLTYIVD